MTYRACPKCGHWHDAAAGCDLRLALTASVSAIGSRQAAADAEETVALARYWHRRRGW